MGISDATATATAIAVREAVDDDHDALIDLAIDLHEVHRPLHPLQRAPDRAEFSRAVADARADSARRVTVAVLGDDISDRGGTSGSRIRSTVVGYAVAVTVERERTHLLEASTVVELDQLGVRPEARGRGAGRALTEDVVAHARRVGASDVLLTVWAANEGARRLYDSLGFGVRQHRMGLRP